MNWNGFAESTHGVIRDTIPEELRKAQKTLVRITSLLAKI
jgi:hypothetical protein